jgi:hypothetical protein
MENSIESSSPQGSPIDVMLVMIALFGLIGVISVIFNPDLVSSLGSAPDAPKPRRNAQAIVSTFNAARAAGNQTIYATKEDAMAAVIAGMNGGGTFSESVFQAPMGSAEVTEASDLIIGFTTPTTSSILQVK